MSLEEKTKNMDAEIRKLEIQSLISAVGGIILGGIASKMELPDLPGKINNLIYGTPLALIGVSQIIKNTSLIKNEILNNFAKSNSKGTSMYSVGLGALLAFQAARLLDYGSLNDNPELLRQSIVTTCYGASFFLTGLSAMLSDYKEINYSPRQK